MTTSVSFTSTFHRRLYPYHRRLASVLLAALCFCLLPGVAAAQLVTPASHIGAICLAIADEVPGGPSGEDGQDTLVQLNRETGDTQKINEITEAGTGNPVGNIEEMAFGPGHQLYAADGDRLGIVDISTGVFTPLGAPVGTGNGFIDGNPVSIRFNDLDALTYDPVEHVFYAVQRRSGDARNDLLLAVDPETGAHKPDYFFDVSAGQNVDFLVVPAILGPLNELLYDVDGLARDPVTGIIYAAVNNDGDDGVLAKLDVETAALTPVGPFLYVDPPATGNAIIDDIEAISFFNDGQFYASTGANGHDAVDLNSLFRIDINTGLGEFVGKFPIDTEDIEALGCLTDEAHIVLKKYTNGPGQPPADADTLDTAPLILEGSTVTWTYIITNTGLLTLTELSLVDDQLPLPIGPDGLSNCPPPGAILSPGGSLTCMATGVAGTGPYTNTATVTAETEPGLVVPTQTVSDTDPSHYIGGSPGIAIRKFTNGQDANDPNGIDVPVIPPGGVISWTYRVTNTGAISLSISDISVSDDRIGPITIIIDKGDGDDILAPNEAWTYAAEGLALDLTTTEAMTLTVPGCDPGGTGTTRRAYQNTGTVTVFNLVATDPSHYCNPVSTTVTAVGDRAWFDTNQNGLQDDGEPGLGGVTVNLYRVGTASPISTTTTGPDGFYAFPDLPLGDYFVEFVPPANHTFTQPNVTGDIQAAAVTQQDDLDSDAVAPVVPVLVSDNGINPSLGEPLTYTIHYTNTSADTDATGVLLQATVPTGTVASLAASSPGWSCSATPAVSGSICQVSIGTVAPNTTDNVQFVVVLDTDEDAVPTIIELVVALTHTTPGRTHVTTPPAEGADLTLDAGFVPGEQRQTSRIGTQLDTIPTNLDETDQPGQPHRLFAPLIER